MGRIKDTQKYIYDTNITGDDYLIGSDAENNGQTKNFRLEDLAGYFSEFFAGTNQNITLTGNIAGGNGITIVNTTAQPSLINDKPETDILSTGNKFLYLEDGALKQLDWSIIAEYVLANAGSYIPPTYTPIGLTGGGLSFVSALTTNNLGHTTAASLGTIQSASTTQQGVIRIATPGEYTGGSTSIALPPAAMSNFLPTSAISGTTNFIPRFTSSSSIGNSVMQQSGTSIGIDTIPTEKLSVGGYALATGYKTPTNNPEVLLSTNGGEVIAPTDIDITGGEINLTPYTDTISSSATIPSNRYQLMYITYDGGGVVDIINLPTTPLKGCRIYIINIGVNGIIIQNGMTIVYELKPNAMSICHYNGSNWIVTLAIDTITA